MRAFTLTTLAAAAALVSAAATARSNLENPAPGSYRSGVGVISGWACNAASATVEVLINGTNRLPVARGTPRSDTASVCGRTDTGFGLLVNYNSFGAGTHTAQLLIDGAPVGAAHSFTVVRPAGEFATGLNREVSVSDFPRPGQTTTLIWDQAQQNFVIKSVTASGGSGSDGFNALAGTYRCTATGTGAAVGTVTIQPSGLASISVTDLATGERLTGTAQLQPDGSFSTTVSGTVSGASITSNYSGRFQKPANANAYGSGQWNASTGTSGTWRCDAQ